MFEGRSWLIDPRDFVGAAKIELDRKEAGFTIRLVSANFAGTRLRADFVARIYRAGRIWRLSLAAPFLRAAGDLGLSDWLNDTAIVQNRGARRLVLADHVLRLGRGTIALSSKNGLTLAFRSRSSSLRGNLKFRCSGITLHPGQGGKQESSLAELAGDRGHAVTHFELSDPRNGRNPEIGLGSPEQRFIPDIVRRIRGEAYQDAFGDALAALIEGSGWIEGALGSTIAKDLYFEHGVIFVSRATSSFAGRLIEGQIIRRGTTALKVASGSKRTLIAHYPRNQSPWLSGDLGIKEMRFSSGDASTLVDLSHSLQQLVLNTAAATPSLTIQAKLDAKGGSAIDADAEVLRATSKYRRVDAMPSKNERAFDESENDDGSAPSFGAAMPMDNARVVLRRDKDLLNVEFRFVGFELRQWNKAEPMLHRTAPADHARIIAQFQPQHIWEHVEPKPKGCATPVATPVAANVSGPSRIAFAPNTENDWKKLRLTVDDLLDWTQLKTVVDPRAAASRQLGFDDHAIFIGLKDENTHLPDLYKLIAGSIKEPDPESTALELADRLIFSPAERVLPKGATTERNAGGERIQWEQQKSGKIAKGVPLWNVRLDKAGRKTLRALWSSYLKGSVFPTDMDFAANPGTERAVSSRSAWEIVAQTSLYGLPGMRRIDPADDKLNKELRDALKSVPRSEVIKPATNYTFFKDIGKLEDPDDPKMPRRKYDPAEIGIILPSTFDDADITLSSLGAIFDARWERDPARIRPDQRNFPLADAAKYPPAGFGLEKFNYRTWLGRDIRVVAARKGYLFPLGVRASYVELSERYFYPEASAQRAAVSFEVKRVFIRCRTDEKIFPAINQPYASNDFPTLTVKMLTEVTPDLADPNANSINTELQKIADKLQWGKMPLPEDLPIFWPKALDGDGSEFQFLWQTDSGVKASSSLLFVDNNYIGSEKIMELLVRYYYPQAATRLRTASFFGARQRYAAENTEGDTSFDTDNWLLGARGQILGHGKEEIFSVDGRMEGADQPPFYPYVDRAQIIVQTLDRLLGHSHGLITVDYNDPYRKLGFGKAGHASEIYLKVLSPRIALDVSGRSQSAGGVASPNALVAAISRKTGIVGGKDIEAPPSGLQLYQTVSQGFDFAEADKNKFDPAEYFGFKGAKLLGVLDLATVIEQSLDLSDAPQLLETIGYGALDASGGIDRIRNAAGKAKNIASGFIANIGKLDKDIEKEIGLSFDQIYPELAKQLLAAEKLPDLFGKIEKAAGPADTIDPVKDIVKITKPLISAIEQTVRNPIPAIADDILDDFKAVAAKLGDEFAKDWEKLAKALLSDVSASLNSAICDAFAKSAPIAMPLFGVSKATSCDALLRSPRDFADACAQALFAEKLAKPLATLLAQAADLQEAAERKFSFAAEMLRQHALEKIRLAVSRIEDRLSAAQLANDIRKPETQIGFTIAVAEAGHKALKDAFDNAKLETVRGAFEAQFKLLIAKCVDDLKDTINPDEERIPAAAAGAKMLSSKDTLLHEVRDTVQQALIDAGVDRVSKDAERVLKVADDFKAGTARDLLKRLGQLLRAEIAGLIEVQEFARIAAFRNSVAGWCDTATDQARSFARDVYDPTATLDVRLATFRTQALKIDFAQVKPSLSVDVVIAAEDARRELLQLVESLIGLIRPIEEALKALSAGTGCAVAQSTLEPLRQTLITRRAFTRKLLALATPLAKLGRLLENSKASEIDTWAKGLLDIARPMIGGATTLAALQKSTLPAQIKQLAEMLPKGESYGTDLRSTVDRLEQEAGKLQVALNAIQTVADLKSLTGFSETLDTYIDGLERQILPLLLQSVALQQNATGLWSRGLADALKMATGAVNIVHKPLADQIATFTTNLANYKAFVSFVIGEAAFKRLLEACAAIKVEQDLLDLIAKAATPDDQRIIKARELAQKWATGNPALVEVLVVLTDFISDFLSGKFGESLIARLKAELATYKDELKDFVAQLLPTSIKTGYTWNGTIKSGDIFSMQPRTTMEKDLKLDVQVEVDLLKNKRTVTTIGTLQPFQLVLLPQANMATIKFRQLTFKSVNGSTPDFNVKVQEVIIGPFLTFLEPLKALMSPSGPGFFIRPTLIDPGPGIEAGFQFGTDLIQVASLSFQNIFLSVSAWLPFGNQAAQFTFAFASAERPFLISSPPYGGGGYVKLTVEPGGGDRQLELAFMFGAVTAIKFGPLKGNGRVVVGFGVRFFNGGTTIKALFEAIGEGSIACFSISVVLRVTAYHFQDGQMYGEAEFSFKFKLGFLSYSYTVKASYRQGGGHSSLAAQKRMAAFEKANPRLAGPKFHYKTEAVAMNRSFKAYRSHIDTSLI